MTEEERTSVIEGERERETERERERTSERTSERQVKSPRRPLRRLACPDPPSLPPEEKGERERERESERTNERASDNPPKKDARPSENQSPKPQTLNAHLKRLTTPKPKP